MMAENSDSAPVLLQEKRLSGEEVTVSKFSRIQHCEMRGCKVTIERFGMVDQTTLIECDVTVAPEDAVFARNWMEGGSLTGIPEGDSNVFVGVERWTHPR